MTIKKGVSTISKCPICGKELKKKKIVLFGVEKEIDITCDCQIKADKEWEENHKQEEKQRKYNERFKHSRIGKRFKANTFDNFELTEDNKQMYETVKEYAEAFNKKDGLLITSAPGTGKTHLMVALANKLIKDGKSVVFVVVPDLLQQIRDTFNGIGSENQIMYGLSECDLLILDDIGSEKKSDWATERLYTIINQRYNDNKSICFTTNCDSVELRERLGDRTISRILEMCNILKVEGKDYRLKKYNMKNRC